MQIQLNTDKHITGSPELTARVEATLRHELRFVADAMTRVEVHLNDVNSNKGGDDDIRCLLEARIARMAPLAAEHRADTIDLALNGAASQLARLVKAALEKVTTRGKGGPSIRHSEDEAE